MTLYTWIPVLIVVNILFYIAIEARYEENVPSKERFQDYYDFELEADTEEETNGDFAMDATWVSEETTEDITMDAMWLSTDPYEDYCAPHIDIWPCECSGDTTIVDITCNGVVDREVLDRILAASFPIRDMNRLQIWYSKIGNITADFLQGNTFQDIDLYGSGIESLDINTFSGCRHRLTALRVMTNSLLYFDFSQITHYPLLNFLGLSSNFISSLDSLVGLEPHWAMLYLYLDNNEISSINETVFYSVPNVTTLDLSSNNLTSLPRYVFMPLTNLQTLYLKNNNLVQLNAGDMWFSTPILRSLDLNSNGLKVVEKDTFKGITSSPKVSVDFNDLDYFSYDMFGELLHNISLEYGWISIWFNRVVCDCDLLWVLMDDTMMDHLLYGSCKNHTDLHALDVDVAIEECTPGP